MSGGSSSLGNVSRISALIVDDDPVIRKLHSAMLKSLGIQFQLAVNGKEAVDLYRSGANIHIVFMDMEMPVMNGMEATKELRAMGVSSIIVGVSSRCSDEEREEFISAGLDHCYAKPLTVAKIKSLLEGIKY
ncbi:two-component response regulator 24-like [Pistacia vera]|uniref:two-component response regulator 24-like n=1 Tax=Pistacia vera TaxID=55513 RepID=UPI0012630578|nr:two-component response regulator 24-like [Pistacia vera]